MGNPFHSGERQRSEAAEQIIASRTEDAFQVCKGGEIIKIFLNIRKRKGAVVFNMCGIIFILDKLSEKSQKQLTDLLTHPFLKI